MGTKALHSAGQGRLRPSFFFCLGVSVVFGALAQQAVFRCGQEYTNAPADASRCERLQPQAVTVIPGTRVQTPAAVRDATLPAQAPLAPPMASTTASELASRPREQMALSILDAELEQARQRHASLMQAYHRGEPPRTPDEVHDPQKYQDRVQRLKVALERAQRDIESLQRERMRRPVVPTPP